MEQIASRLRGEELAAFPSSFLSFTAIHREGQRGTKRNARREFRFAACVPGARYGISRTVR